LNDLGVRRDAIDAPTAPIHARKSVRMTAVMSPRRQASVT